MARIFVSFSNTDKNVFVPLINELRGYGHILSYDTEVLMNQAQSFQATLIDQINDSDIILVGITENIIKSNAVMNEIITAKAFTDQSGGKKSMLAIIYGDVLLPEIINSIYHIELDKHTYKEIASTINQYILEFLARKEALEQKEVTKREIIEKKASDFIDPTLANLSKREARNNLVAISCYVVGFLALVLGIYFTIAGLGTLDRISQANYVIFVLLILKSIIIVSLLIACSKYAFNLGKTYMNEALRNADRGHAISFGRFYLQAYPDRANTFEEIKSIFQNWNIDKESAFQKLNTDSYDPKLFDKMLDLAKTLGEKVGK